ncbi:MAG: cyclic nucleotide-binding:Sulfate transporter/antisigma-factor antagonist STAS:xanthine/uracil/vitamin C permease:sulfate transporter [Methylococcaceae bacterium NSP1-2]|nr:cyclic nucleotide-binding domain-containing protein [Methylococcaceae bacterium]OYV21464.1 MAG: cyclic nucleotide-binding:Sulfate transporter/antisigma-factor antagonist STAS:xanthine/uracil/vitamin C permease:sulfate transporter [Methylococcaceae bacterium NSP1-2]
MNRNVINEFWGGLAAMLVALPSAIAFGVLVFSAISPQMAGEGAFVGMMGAAILGLTAPLFGRTPALISGPCAPAAAILSALAVDLLGRGIAIPHVSGLLALTALLSALLQALYGLLKGGQLIKYIPFPVVSGYLSGVSLIIATGQLPKLLGLPKGTEFWHGLLTPNLWQWQGIVVGVITVTVMLIAPRLTQKIPATIIGLFVGILSYFALGLWMPHLLSLDANSLVVGAMPSGSSFLATVSERLTFVADIQIADLRTVAYSAIALSVLLSIDTLKTCVILDTITKNRHNSNRELLGQGLANLATFMAGGMSGSGTMGATLMNVSSGGRTILSGFIEGGLVVLALLVLSPLIAWVPISALAGILLVIAFRIFDWHAFRLLKHRETRLDFMVIAAVVVVAESVGLISAAGTGVGLAILLFIRDQIRISVLRRRTTLKEVSSKTYRLKSEDDLLQQHGDEASIIDLQGNLFFGTTDYLFTQLEDDLRTQKWLLFDMRRVQSLDYTATHLFAMMHDRLKEHGGALLFSGMPSSLLGGQDFQRYMTDVGLLDEGGIHIFEMRDDALEWMENRLLEASGWTEKTDQTPLEFKDIEILREMDEKTITALRQCVEERIVHAGEAIFTVGDSGDEIFLIRRGIVRILLPLKGGKYHHLATFSRGDYFGEMAFLDCKQRSANAIAKTECELYVLSRKKFNIRVYDNAVLGARVFARLASALSLRLRQTDSELSVLEDR